MRISTNLFNERSSQAILEQQAKLSKSQLHVATGKRIMQPSDDPAGATRIMALNQVAETVTQYQENAQTLQSRHEIEDITLDSAINLMQRARELALQGATGTLSAEQRLSLSAEVDQLLDGMLGLANSRDPNGEYMFSGLQRAVQPFTDLGGGVFQYNGDQARRYLKVSDDRLILDNETGFELFMDIADGGGGVQSAFTTLYNLADDLRNNIPPNASITEVDRAMENFVKIRAKVGARLNAVDNQKNSNESFLLSMRTQISELEDLDYAAAITKMNTDMVALQAAQQAYVKIQGLSLFNLM